MNLLHPSARKISLHTQVQTNQGEHECVALQPADGPVRLSCTLLAATGSPTLLRAGDSG